MTKRGKSQWDFGELFPAEQFRKVLTVSELTLQIRRLLEEQFAVVWVTGEISNLRLQNSGHIYFTLKDADAQLGCVVFRGQGGVDRQLLQDGRRVNIQGEVTVYEPRGQYQLRVITAESQGFGALQAAFERLKQKLAAEGLFAPERKRPIPRFPQRIGLVTSATGAAIRDVLHVVSRRNPALKVVLAPCRVQGEGAAAEIAAAIALLNEYQARLHAANNAAEALDLILVTRGGGSLEDLWAFNEEVVARAMFRSELPVISAVGHEIDITIGDFVADLRAATPSAAAEIITEGIHGSCQFVASAGDHLRGLVLRQVEDRREALSRTMERLSRRHPRRHLNDSIQRLDDLRTSLARCVSTSLKTSRVAWRTAAERLARVRPAILLKQRREVFNQAQSRLQETARHRLSELQDRVRGLQTRLRLLGPEQTLARGYSITFDAASGQVCRQPASLKSGQLLRTRLQGGEVRSRVEPP
jgi:exodeoxyribonuclease VII large subunit